MEELAQENLFHKLQADAQQLADTLDIPVYIRKLGATRAGIDRDVASPTAAVVGQTRVHVGLSAVVTWFISPRLEPACTVLDVAVLCSYFGGWETLFAPHRFGVGRTIVILRKLPRDSSRSGS